MNAPHDTAYISSVIQAKITLRDFRLTAPLNSVCAQERMLRVIDIERNSGLFACQVLDQQQLLGAARIRPFLMPLSFFNHSIPSVIVPVMDIRIMVMLVGQRLMDV